MWTYPKNDHPVAAITQTNSWQLNVALLINFLLLWKEMDSSARHKNYPFPLKGDKLFDVA